MREYESPTALTTRPTVALRQIPGKTIRVPARSGTLLLVALIGWGLGVVALPIAWDMLAGIVGIPASLLALLVEWKPGGKPPLAWASILVRHLTRPVTLTHRRLAHRPIKQKG
jgi:hypothetical protein